MIERKLESLITPSRIPPVPDEFKEEISILFYGLTDHSPEATVRRANAFKKQLRTIRDTREKTTEATKLWTKLEKLRALR
jgi:hypothetical protein